MMKKEIISTFLMMLIASVSLSQDIIIKKDGSRVEAKVIEITITMIKYEKYDYPGGPIRNVAISDVHSIEFENGDIEVFNAKTSSNNTQSNTVINNEPSVPDEKDPIHENGLFIEGMIGFSSLTYPVNNYNYNTGTTTTSSESLGEASIQMRLGSKWYFGSLEKKWRPGVQLTFLRIAIYHDFDFPNSYSLSPLNLGFANVFKFSEKTGLEINANFGFNVMNFVPALPGFWGNSNWRGDGGIIYGAEVKYRYKSFAVGLDYSRINTFVKNNTRNLVSLSVGRKF